MSGYKIYSGTVLVLGIVQFIESIAFSMPQSYFPNYVVGLGATVASIGLFTSSFMLAEMILSPRMGSLSDVHGRRAPPAGNRERAYEVSKDFVGRFKTKFGTTICGELIGDLLREATEESEEKRKARCSQYTLNAAKMCAETLLKFEKLYPQR